MKKLKVDIEGEAKLISIYQCGDVDEKYFARIDLKFESNNSLVCTTIDLPITYEEYSSFKNQLRSQSKDLAEIYNDPTDRRPVLKIKGDLELRLSPEYLAGKIHNTKNGFPYWVDKEKIKKGVIKIV